MFTEIWKIVWIFINRCRNAVSNFNPLNLKLGFNENFTFQKFLSWIFTDMLEDMCTIIQYIFNICIQYITFNILQGFLWNVYNCCKLTYEISINCIFSYQPIFVCVRLSTFPVLLMGEPNIKKHFPSLHGKPIFYALAS